MPLEQASIHQVTVHEFMDKWVATLPPCTPPRPGTLPDQGKQIIPNIGQVPLQKLRPVHLADPYRKTIEGRSVAANGPDMCIDFHIAPSVMQAPGASRRTSRRW